MITTLIDQQVYCASPSIHDMTPVFLNLLQMKSPNLYRHSHQVANKAIILPIHTQSPTSPLHNTLSAPTVYYFYLDNYT